MRRSLPELMIGLSCLVAALAIAAYMEQATKTIKSRREAEESQRMISALSRLADVTEPFFNEEEGEAA